MSFPVTVFDFSGESLSDDEWTLDCCFCPKRESFSGPIYKVVDYPEEEGWTMVNGEIACPICSNRLKEVASRRYGKESQDKESK